MQYYLKIKKTFNFPRLPLKGSLDLTYRCNNHCRHCWLWESPKQARTKEELTFEEIRTIVGDARKLGCREWSISGGEPMLRADFSEIFDYLTRCSHTYSLNTNGTLITPQVAKLLRRKGNKMVALYGATAKVHDRITRTPGSFEAAMRGFRYLREAGAGFTVQLIPMRDNYHQFQDMIKLAQRLSRHYRVGAPWLYLSACGNAQVNQEILRQRLAPPEVVALDQPDLSFERPIEVDAGHRYCSAGKETHFFASCIDIRRDFHIDPYGGMTFCCFIKDPEFRYDLRVGNFQEAWDRFIPSLAKKVKIGEEYRKNCGSCDARADCRWCPVYGYLEHRRFSAKVGYLCKVANENKKYKETWMKKNRRFYKIADLTLQVDSDLPITERTFDKKFKKFEVKGKPRADISIRHHFSLLDLKKTELGQELYRKAPWAIYRKKDSWIYLGISPAQGDPILHRVVIFNQNHTRARIHNDGDGVFKKGNLHSLTLFPTDQILLARVLADRDGCFLHSCGIKWKGKGLLFAGHSEAGKSTTARMFKRYAKSAETLCDDRIIVRKGKKGFKMYGTWSHGDVPDVSSASAPLKAILFLEQAKENRLIPLSDKKEIAKRLVSVLIKPFITADWWEKSLTFLEKISEGVPCYVMRFDRTGKVIKLLEDI